MKVGIEVACSAVRSPGRRGGRLMRRPAGFFLAEAC
jgi:hypothetical protein